MRRLRAELIPRIPEPARVVLRNAVWTYGRATAFARPLPDFLILGAQKSGTTALYAYLRWHPAITGPPWKEVSFFDRHYRRGERWYRGHFASRPRLWLSERRNGARTIVGEASPSYLFHPLGPERVKEVVPGVRLIALLRNPVDRAYSHYQHEVALGREPLQFEEALDREEERTRGEEERMIRDPGYFSHAWWNHTYLARGRYAEQLERWYAAFPRERLLVLPSEDLSDRPGEAYARVLDFLGAAPHRLDSFPRVFDREYAPMPAAGRRRLVEYYAEPNRRLSKLLDLELGWDE